MAVCIQRQEFEEQELFSPHFDIMDGLLHVSYNEQSINAEQHCGDCAINLDWFNKTRSD